jgi:hypothetical protein
MEMTSGWGIEIPGGWFDQERHLYRDEQGFPVTSTTGVFDALGMVDFSGIDPERVKWKQGYGLATHRASEFVVYDSLDWDSCDPVIVPAVTGIEQYLKAIQYEPEAVEEKKIVTVNGMKYGMTLDHRGTCMYHGTRRSIVIDLKTCSKSSPTWNWQGGAYVKGSGKAKAGSWLCLILQVNLVGKTTPHWIEPIRAAREFEILLAAANLKINAGLAKIKNVEEED